MFNGAQFPVGVSYSKSDITVDQQYNAESKNPQSGVAVAEAVLPVKTIAETAERIAKGKATGYVFDTLEDLDLWLADANNIAKLTLGDNLYIREIDVPDFWWDGTQKQQLETQKAELVDCIKNTDYATREKAGLAYANDAEGICVYPPDSKSPGRLSIRPADEHDIDGKEAYYVPITPKRLDYAVKKAIADSKETLTPAEQSAAQKWLGGSMIKTIEPDENGVYRFRPYEMETGMYSLPTGTKIYPYGATSEYTITKAYDLIMCISKREDGSGCNWLCLCGGAMLFWGTSSENSGSFGEFPFQAAVLTSTTQTIFGEKTFSTAPKMTGELLVDDNSTSIPNTAWVQSLLQEAHKEWRLYDEMEVTQLDIDNAGEEGITTLLLGDGITTLPSDTKEILISMYIPTNSSTASQPKFLFSQNDNHYGNIIIYGSGGLLFGNTVQHTKVYANYDIGISQYSSGKYSNGYAEYGAIATLHNSLAWEYTNYFKISTNGNAFKFPAGTTVKIEYR